IGSNQIESLSRLHPRTDQTKADDVRYVLHPPLTGEHSGEDEARPRIALLLQLDEFAPPEPELMLPIGPVDRANAGSDSHQLAGVVVRVISPSLWSETLRVARWP